MQVGLLLTFPNHTGVECNKCILNVLVNNNNVCIALGSTFSCPKDGKLINCPLIPVEEEE